MDTNTFLLFSSCLIFSGFSFYCNTKTTQVNIISVIMRFAFLVFGFAALISAYIVLYGELVK